jgi:hypothetical protein
MKTCACGGKLDFPEFDTLCDACGKKACQEKGEHSWDIDCIGGGVAEFSCLYCGAHSSGTMEPMRKYGFVPIDEIKNRVL